MVPSTPDKIYRTVPYRFSFQTIWTAEEGQQPQRSYRQRMAKACKRCQLCIWPPLCKEHRLPERFDREPFLAGCQLGRPTLAP